MPSCHIPSVWQVYFLLCNACSALRWIGQVAHGHQGNVMNLSWEESQRDGVAWGWCFTCLTCLSLGRDELFIFLFFSWEKHWSWNQGSPVWQSACVTAPCQSPTHLFQRQPCLVCFPSVPYSTHPLLSFKEFSLYPPSASCFCLLLKRLIRTSFDGSLDCLSVEKEEWCLKRLYVRVNSFKRACE